MNLPRFLVVLVIVTLLCGISEGAVWMVSPGESIQAAINGAASGDTVVVVAGYYPEPLSLNRSITIRGEHYPVIDACNLPNRDGITITADGVTIQGVSVINASRAGINVSAHHSSILDANLSRHGHSGIAIRSVNGTTIRDTSCHDIVTGSPGYGVYLSQAQDTVMENITVKTTNGAGIYLFRAAHASMNDLTVSEVLSHGVFVRMSSGITINESLITRNGNGATTCGIVIENSPATLITATSLIDNRCQGIRLSFADGSIITHTTISGDGVRGFCSGTGAVLESTTSAMLTRSTITGHATGLQLISSPAAAIFQNSFRDNTLPVSVIATTASWFSPSPVIYTYRGSAFTNRTGNFWEGYSGNDLNDDGLGEIPYTVTGTQQDTAPLIEEGGAYTFPDLAFLIGECTFTGPLDIIAEAGVPSELLTGRIQVEGVTPLPGPSGTLAIDAGYGEEGVPPLQWTAWTPLSFARDNGTVDEYEGTLTIPTPGTYHTLLRASRSSGPSYYCGSGGIQSGSLTTTLGTVTVTDTTPPPCMTELTTAGILPTSLTWTWESPSSDDLDHLSVFLNGIWYVNLSARDTTFTAHNLTPTTCYDLAVECADAAGNVNTTRAITTSCTLSAPDTIPPGSVTNLRCTMIRPDTLTWQWDDPTDQDLASVLVSLNGTVHTTVAPGVEMLTISFLEPRTPYTLAFQTLDTSGNLNHSWVNHTATTALGNAHQSRGSGSRTHNGSTVPHTPVPTTTFPASEAAKPPATLPPKPSMNPTLPPVTGPSFPSSTPVAPLLPAIPILSLAVTMVVMGRMLGKR